MVVSAVGPPGGSEAVAAAGRLHGLAGLFLTVAVVLGRGFQAFADRLQVLENLVRGGVEALDQRVERNRRVTSPNTVKAVELVTQVAHVRGRVLLDGERVL